MNINGIIFESSVLNLDEKKQELHIYLVMKQRPLQEKFSHCRGDAYNHHLENQILCNVSYNKWNVTIFWEVWLLLQHRIHVRGRPFILTQSFTTSHADSLLSTWAGRRSVKAMIWFRLLHFYPKNKQTKKQQSQCWYRSGREWRM